MKIGPGLADRRDQGRALPAGGVAGSQMYQGETVVSLGHCSVLEGKILESEAVW